MENNSDIPFMEGPVDPQTGDYSFILPTRFNDDESNVVVQFHANTTREQAIAELRTSFPRNSADTQVQKMTDPDWATKINAADYLQYKKEEDKYPKQKTELYGILKETAADLLGSAVTIASESGKAAWNASPLTNALGIGDQRMAARHAWNIVEAGVQGNERLSMLGGLLGMKIGDLLTENPFKDTESSVESDLRRVQYAQEMGKILAARKAGNLATENNGDTPSYLITKPEGVPAATKADVDAANSMSNLLDVTMAIPGAAFTKVGEVAGNTMFKYVMPAALVETGLKAGFAASKVAGSALDATSKFIFNKISQVTEAVAEGAVTDAGKAIANYAAKGAMYGGLFMGPGGKLIGMSLGGKALKAIGEVGGAVMEGLEKGEARAVLQELGENELKAATVRQAARIASAIAPPDIAINAIKGALDSALNVGAAMGGLGAMTAWASNDDPIRGFQEGMASGLGAGLVFGAAQLPFAMREAQQLKLINYFQNDLVGRPKEQSFDVTHPSGHIETVTFNDLQGRIDLFNRKDLTDRQKAMIVALGGAHERAGGNTIFVDGSPESIQKLNDIGFAGVKGVHTFDGTDGRSTILINPRSVDAAVAAEEVMHSMFSEYISREVREGIQSGLKQADPDAWINEVESFANRYMNELELSGHEDAADTMRAGIEAAKDPSVPLEDKIRYMDYAINEYISNYVGTAVHGMKPENLMQGPVMKNIWDKVWDKTVSNILSVFDFTKSGLSKDPVRGHFFDERGRRVQMPELEGIVGRFVDAVREGRGEIYSKHTVDGAHYVDVRDTKPYVSYEDFVEGKPTTLAQKKKIHKSAYEQNVAAASAIDPNLIAIATPDVVESGKFGGNLGGLKNKRVLFARELPEAFFGHLANQEVNGVKVYTNEQIQALRGLNESAKAGHIVMLDAWHDIKRTKGDRSEAYYGRTNRPGRLISWQQTETGGLIVNFLDLGRVWSQIRYFARHEPNLRAALNDRDIHTLVDVLPYFQLYFDNYSSGKPVPAAKLEAFDEALRDGISRALNIKNRASYKAVDEARFVNQHTFDTEGFPAQPKPIVEVNGVQREVNRDRVSIQSIRADRIMGLNDFKVGGFNVPIKYDPELATNLIRANFTPGATAFERLPNGEILTDKVTGDKIIVKPTGKATLMQGERKSIHANVEEAILEADKRSVANTKRRASFSVSSREDMPEGPVYSKEQAQEIINGSPEWSLNSLFKNEVKNQKKIERTYNRFLMSDPPAKRYDALNSAASLVEDLAGIKIDKAKFPFFLENGKGVPLLGKEQLQSIKQAYPEIADLFELGNIEYNIQGKKEMGISLDAFSFDKNNLYSEKIGRQMSELTDRIVESSGGKMSRSQALNNASQIYGAFKEVFSKTSDDIATEKLKNQFIALRDAIRPSFAPKRNTESKLLYKNFKDTFPNVKEMVSSDREIALRKWMREYSEVSPFELRSLGRENLLWLQEAFRKSKPTTINPAVKASEEFRQKVKEHDRLMAKIRSAFNAVDKIEIRPGNEPLPLPNAKKSKIASTIDSLSTKPGASNQVIAGAVDKAYMQGELPLEVVRNVRSKLSESIDENYVPKREEALQVAKGSEPATAEEYIAQQEAELKAAGMKVPRYDATPEEMAQVDAQRHETESALRAKHLAQTAGINEKMQAGFAEKSDKQRMRLEEQTNRMLNANRAEQLAAGTRAMKRAEQERVAGRKQDVIEAFKAEREAQKAAVERAKAQEAAAAYLKAEELAKQREAAKSIERQQKGENIQRQADTVRLAERRRGMSEILTEQSKRQREFARQEAKNQKNAEKADKWHKKARAERAAEDAKLLAEKEMQDKARYERNRQHALAMEELLKEAPTATLGEETPKGTKVIDKQIPRAANILITPGLKFRIYLNSGGLIGVTDSYEQAIRTAKRHAA